MAKLWVNVTRTEIETAAMWREKMAHPESLPKLDLGELGETM